MNRELNIGATYKHFKGGEYEVQGISQPFSPNFINLGVYTSRVATHTETMQELNIAYKNGMCCHHILDCEDILVIYHSKLNEKLWARPLHSFTGVVAINNTLYNRFEELL